MKTKSLIISLALLCPLLLATRASAEHKITIHIHNHTSSSLYATVDCNNSGNSVCEDGSSTTEIPANEHGTVHWKVANSTARQDSDDTGTGGDAYVYVCSSDSQCSDVAKYAYNYKDVKNDTDTVINDSNNSSCNSSYSCNDESNDAHDRELAIKSNS